MKYFLGLFLAATLLTACKDDDDKDADQVAVGTLVVAFGGNRLESTNAVGLLTDGLDADLAIAGASASGTQSASISLFGDVSAIVAGTVHSAGEGSECVGSSGAELCAVLIFASQTSGGAMSFVTAIEGGSSTLTITEADVRDGGVIRGEISGTVVNPVTEETFVITECRFAAPIQKF